MKLQSFITVLQRMQHDTTLNASGWINFDINITPFSSDAIALSKAIPMLFCVSEFTFNKLKYLSERYIHHEKMVCIDKKFDNLIAESRTEYERKYIIAERELLQFKKPTESEHFLNATGRTGARYADEIVNELYLSYMAGKINILGEWQSHETLVEPHVFCKWAQDKGYTLPAKLVQWLEARKGSGNRTGSKKNTSQIEYTQKYCEQVLDGILRKNEIDISRDEFEKRLNECLKKGESIHKDTFRKFIVNSVPPERRAPQGRTRKK